MPEHGHSECPHCDVALAGSEVTCPSCSGPLFGIAPKEKVAEVETVISADSDSDNSGLTETTIGDIAVPTYTPSGIVSSAENIDSTNPIPSSNNDVDSLIQQGEAMGLVGDHEGASAAFNQAIAIDPSNHMAWFNRGVMSEARGDVEDAIKAFNLALENDPEHGASSANLAVLMDRLGRHDEATVHATAGLAAFPGHPALVEIVNRDGGIVPEVSPTASGPEESVEVAEESVEASEEMMETEIFVEQVVDPIVVESEPEIIEETDIWAEPTGNVKTLGAPESTPEPQPEPEPEPQPEPVQLAEPPTSNQIDLDALADSAADMIRAGDPAAALEALRDLLPGAASEHAPCWRIAAGAMARLDLVDSAIEAFSYALDLDDSDSQGWFNLGTLQRRTSNLNGAIESFSRALALNSNYPKAANGLALACMENGDIERSIGAFRDLLSIEPGHQSAVTFASLLIDLAEGEGRVMELVDTLPTTLPEGPDMAREALSHLPLENTHENIVLRARAHTINGDHPEAVTLWKGLLEAEKNNPELWLGLAKALSAAGSEDKAAACREKARTLGAHIAESTPQNEGDLWAEANAEPAVVEEEIVPTPNAEEIVVHEAALDTVSEPEPIQYEPVDENVDLAAAVLEAQSAVSTEPDEEVAESSSIANQDIEWYNKGIELLTKERNSEALSCFERALPSFKDDKVMAIKILNGRGNCFYNMEQYKKAIESYYKAFEIDKKLTTGNALYNMGTAYAELESYENAIHCFNQAIGREVGEPLKGENKKRCKEQIRRCKLLLKEKK
ncbi:MAG: tetratricopeptide repeat protein [Candidatus Thermoplasmatota archaeon]|nr:tetratricopeptide repeat protein [Candidatus Thermoplasmatota archaeon]